jgi:hypothetical protein
MLKLTVEPAAEPVEHPAHLASASSRPNSPTGRRRLVGPHLQLLLEAQLPDPQRLRHLLHVLDLEAAVDLKGGRDGEGGLLEQVYVLNQRVNEHVVAQRRHVAQRPLRRPVQ